MQLAFLEKGTTVLRSEKIDRRKPKQSRALTTCSAIFEATAQILEKDGERRLTTNRIAERAGVSIGTLYQYFESKEAILIEMTRAEMEAHQSATIEASKSSSQDEAIRGYVRAMIKGFEGRPATRKAAIKAWMSVETAQSLKREIHGVQKRLPALPKMTKTDAFIISRSLQWVVRSAVLEEFEELYSPEFEDGLVALLTGYIEQIAMRSTGK